MSGPCTRALSSFPSKERGGALTTKTLSPLTLHAVFVDVTIIGFSVRVQLHLECINETTENQRVLMAYPVPLRWNLMKSDVKYDGHELTTELAATRVFTTNESGSGVNTNSTASKSVYRLSCQYVPWEMMVGTTIYAVATYSVPLPELMDSNGFSFSLPAALFPTMQRPAQTELEYNMLFQLKTQKVLRAGITIRVTADLFHPLQEQRVLLMREDVLRAGVGVEVLEAAVVEYRGDSSFTLTYWEPMKGILCQPFLLSCPVAASLEPLRLFVGAELGTAGVTPSSDPRNSVAEAVGTYAVGIGFTLHTGRRYDEDINTELIYVLDLHSAESAAAVARGLRVVLPGLHPAVRINFVFPRDSGEHMVTYISGSQPVSSVVLDEICAFTAQLMPQVPQSGASHLAAVVGALCRQQGGVGGGAIPTGYVRHVVVVTDEGVTNPRVAVSMTEEAVAQAHTMQISVLGLVYSASVSVPPLVLLSRETGGLYEEAATLEDVPSSMVLVAASAAVPTLTNIRAEFVPQPSVATTPEESASDAAAAAPSSSSSSVRASKNAPAKTVKCCFDPARLPVIPAGRQRHLYALFPSTAQPAWRLVITGHVGEMLSEFNCECTLDKSSAAYPSTTVQGDVLSVGLLHSAAAAARIRYLVHPRTAIQKEAVDEVRATSLACSLLTPYTQIIQKASNIPVVAGQTPAEAVIAAYAADQDTYELEMQSHQQMLYAYDTGKRPLRSSEKPIAPCLPRKPPAAREFIEDLLLSLLNTVLCEPNAEQLTHLQHRDGSFTLNFTLSSCVGIPYQRMTAMKPDGCTEQVWATIISLVAARKAKTNLTVLLERQAHRYLRHSCSEDDMKAWKETAEGGLFVDRVASTSSQ